MTLLLAAILCQECVADHPAPAVSGVGHRFVRESLNSSVALVSSHASISGERPELVSVSWTFLPLQLQSESWVGVYLEGDDLTKVVPLKYQFCNHTLQALSATGRPNFENGSLHFEILNYRHDVVFKIFAGWERPVLIASTAPVKIDVPESPSGIHLALTGIDGEMAVTWTSLRGGTTPSVEFHVVESSGRLRNATAAAGPGQTYARHELCGAPATAQGWRDPGTFWTGVMDRLQPGNIVRYRVGTDEAWSSYFTFRAPPMAGSPVRILAFGDMGQKPLDACHQAQGDEWKKQEYSEGDPGAEDTVQALQQDHKEHPADAVFHNGDLSYAMGYGTVWESFQTAIEPLAAVVPWMVTMGNHERDWPSSGSTEGDGDSLGECGLPALRRFPAMPYASSEAPPNDRPWWKMSLGAVFIVALSTEHDVTPGHRG